MEFVKSHWRACMLLLMCFALLAWTLLAPPPTAYAKSLYRLTIATLAALLAAHLAEAYETRKSFKGLQDTLSRITQDIPAERLYHVAGKYHHARMIPPEAVQEIWYELCAAMMHSYCATNYVDVRSMYGSPLAEAALAIQKAKITGSGFTISKVFMVDSVDEVLRSREVRDQIAMGIVVKWIQRARVQSAGELDSIDFAIFDGKVVLAWRLDESRQVTGAWLIDDLKQRDRVEQYKKFFTSLAANSSWLPPNVEHDTILRRLTFQEAVEAVSSWEAFRAPFDELSYALDRTDGWLNRYAKRPGSYIFGLFEDRRLIGFSVLDVQPKHQAFGTAEFYIAIDRDYQKRGLGRVLAHYTVCEARRVNLNVFLRIRKNHPAAALYQGCGFDYVVDDAGRRVEVVDTVNGKAVTFLVMKLGDRRRP